MTRIRLWLWTAFLFLPGLVGVAATGVFREQVIPGAPSGATQLVGGPGGFWFTEFETNRIGFLPQDGGFREFNIPTPDSGPLGIVASFDAIWFTEFKAGKIGKLTFDGAVTEYVIPSPQSGPWGITVVSGGTGTIWFTESNANKIGRINRADGTITELAIPTANALPRGIAGLLKPCFAEFGANQIGCVEGNQIVERGLPTPGSGPQDVAGVSDLGDLWFTESVGNRIGVVRPSGSLAQARIEEFAIPTPASGPGGITVDYYEGTAWFTEKSAGQIGSVSPDGRITEYPLTDRSSRPTGVSFSFFIGAEMQLKFLESAANRLVEMEPDAVLTGGAGSSGTWKTEFRVANVENDSVTVFLGAYPRPAFVCPSSCTVPQLLAKLPPGGSFVTDSDKLRITGLGKYRIRVLEDGVLPSVTVRVFNANAPGQSLDLPTIRFSRLIALNPGLLSFPGAMSGGGARSNLWLAEAGGREPLDVVIELIDPDGRLVASRSQTLVAGGSVYLVDVIASLGIATFPDGQLRVRKTGDGGLLWGYLATVDANGALSLYTGLNP